MFIFIQTAVIIHRLYIFMPCYLHDFCGGNIVVTEFLNQVFSGTVVS